MKSHQQEMIAMRSAANLEERRKGNARKGRSNVRTAKAKATEKATEREKARERARARANQANGRTRIGVRKYFLRS